MKTSTFKRIPVIFIVLTNKNVALIYSVTICQQKTKDCALSGILGDPGADKGGEGKSKRAGKYGTKKSKERREELFSPFFTFLRAIFSRPFRLSLAPFICPWVSEDA